MAAPAIIYRPELDLSVESFSARTYSEALSKLPRELTKFLECETKYYAPRTIVEGYFAAKGKALEDFESYEIKQRFYPREMARQVGLDIAGAIGLREIADSLTFTQARLRKIGGEDPSYQMQAKAKIPGINDRMGKLEFSASIPREVYKQEKSEATAGYLAKTRYFVDACIRGRRGERVPIQAEIDRITECGSEKRSQTLRARDRFYTIDLEFEDPNLIKSVRAGRHNFPLLLSAIELSAGDPQIDSVRKSVRTSHLAQNGFDRESRKALETLHRLAWPKLTE